MASAARSGGSPSRGRAPHRVRPPAHRTWCVSASRRSGPTCRCEVASSSTRSPTATYSPPTRRSSGRRGSRCNIPGAYSSSGSSWPNRRPFTTEDQTLLTVLAGRLGQGLQRVHQIDQQRETALALQHAILGPAVLPNGFAVRYQPASRPLQVGGDWYDLVDLDDGRIALDRRRLRRAWPGCGDRDGTAAQCVPGTAAGDIPAPVLRYAGLDRFAARLPGAACTTAFCAVLDPDTGELTYSSAGHPPPILVYADGNARTLRGRPGHPARAANRPAPPRGPRDDARARHPVCCTPTDWWSVAVSHWTTASRRATDLVQDGSASALDDLASEIMGRLAPDGGYQDDVALLLYRQPAPLAVGLSRRRRASSPVLAPPCAVG